LRGTTFKTASYRRLNFAQPSFDAAFAMLITIDPGRLSRKRSASTYESDVR
jgi:hypothetical protein